MNRNMHLRLVSGLGIYLEWHTPPSLFIIATRHVPWSRNPQSLLGESTDQSNDLSMVYLVSLLLEVQSSQSQGAKDRES